MEPSSLKTFCVMTEQLMIQDPAEKMSEISMVVKNFIIKSVFSDHLVQGFPNFVG